MIFEHEIPSGSKLYFGQSAKIKRYIESQCADLLYKEGFEEITTPLFSYHQHDSFEDQNPLIRLNDSDNHTVTLRADSTPDVVRIVTKRLGRSMESKKWFYIQPIYQYPTNEQYQIGGEIIEGSFGNSLAVTIELLKALHINPILQIANISIPKLLSQKYGISLDILRSMQIETILKSEYKWIGNLVTMSSKDDLNDLSYYPDDIKEELAKIKNEVESLDYSNIIVSPLFYAKMRYYDSLTFKMFIDNELLAMGGEYSIKDLKAAGFAIYLDECIRLKLRNQEEKN
ncbi:MAG: ATP phosphoribosyltransferase regulatory subunit [Campylobacterales bacterium]|nr:ATP phosphoribosyltransferase regulatory subunit [Campylobacterales bacterium]